MSIHAMQLFEEKKTGLGKSLTQAQKALALAKQMSVESPEDYRLAGERILIAKQREAFIEGVREEIVVPIGRAHRQMSAEFKKSTDAWRAVWSELNNKRVAYDRAQKALQVSRERELRLLQEKAAAEEKAAALEEAEKAKASGDVELARELESQANAPAIHIPMVKAEPPKTEGLREAKYIKARVVDLDAVPMEFCQKVPDMQVLSALGRRYTKQYQGNVEKANKEAPPGVEFYEDVVPVRGA